ncbi:hypothetical protein SLEP1_g32554 [Rubroshorea leprosula]|uniref:FBD domain-containing protein n=1 Tax=Rubroshorea leprosula TaxID=152421 RepID=A0AAV5KDN8_9ROSI|nr:hypothetical protein SLEP1_g32554 [Rubroshorea leprosula]
MCFSSDDSAERLFSNCPVLEDLVISSYFGEHDDCKLIVSSSTLKRLTIKSVSNEDYNSFEIVINAPNLVYLKYTGCEANSHVFVNVQSLTEAYINFQIYLSEQDYFCPASGLLTGIRNVQTLCLPCSTLHYFKGLSVPIPLFRNLTNLRITHRMPFGFSGLPNLLAQCHCLELLVLELSTGYDPDKRFLWDPYPWNELKESGAICLSFGLKTLEVLSFVGGEHQMEMVKYFLGSARVLENLKIQMKASEEEQLRITEELSMLPKVSQKCRVTFV